MLPDIEHDETACIEDENQGRSPYLAEERIPLVPDDEERDEDVEELDFDHEFDTDLYDPDDYYEDDSDEEYYDDDDGEEDPLDYDDTDHGDEVPF